MAFESLKKLLNLPGRPEPAEAARAASEAQARFLAMEQRLNLLEAALQSSASGGASEEQSRELRSGLDQLAGALQSTVSLLQRVQEGQRRNEEALKAVREKLEMVERSLQSLSIKGA
jgi:hypothetical protein